MQISKIRLAGFKTFVDPTTLQLSDNLTGVVGPNGCGKSNIIDAVLWVLGESSAKHLRGDSMADVIFNGSGARKPVGQAHVEVVFDNADAKLGGQYAAYSEIAIKRQVSRDGTSLYFLNGSRCRRRDISDLFLGTGVGHRSYAVIEQGMISRVVESKPDELRVMIEEAAGISRYKERRRETENRIQHTRDNIDRLNDIRQELEQQVTRLHQQARAAERYQTLKEEERLLRAQILALSWRSYAHELALEQQKIDACANQVEAGIAALRGSEAGIEHLRSEQHRAGEAFNEVQARYYASGAEVSRIEQALQHARERRAGLEQQYEHSQGERETLRERELGQQRELAHLDEGLARDLPDHAGRIAAEQSAHASLVTCEQALEAAQQELERLFNTVAGLQREEAAQASRHLHLGETLAAYAPRLEALCAERDRLAQHSGDATLAQLETELGTETERRSALEQEIVGLEGALAELWQRDKALHREATEQRGALQRLQGRRAALETLQRSTATVGLEAVRDWLGQQGIAVRAFLAEHLVAERGWEVALETVLERLLHGFHVDAVSAIAGAVWPAELGTCTLVATPQDTTRGLAPRLSLPPLADKLQGPHPLQGCLRGVYALESLPEALTRHGELLDGESIVTRDGFWLGPNWLRSPAVREPSFGVLRRQTEIHALCRQEQQLQAEIAVLAADLEGLRERAEGLEAARAGVEQALRQGNERQAVLRSQSAAARTELDHQAARRAALDRDIAELEQQTRQGHELWHQTESQLAALRLQLAALEAGRQGLAARREEAQAQLSTVRQTWHALRDAAHTLALRIESLRAQRNALAQGLEDQSLQRARVEERCEELHAQLAGGPEQILGQETQLAELLAARLQVDGELNSARATLQEIDHGLRAREQERAEREQALEVLRQGLEEVRLRGETLRVKVQDREEQIAASGFSRADLLATLPDEAQPAFWAERLQALEQRLTRLGAINLAAIDELALLSERKTYLDAQHADLSEALATLEEAIHRIDKETRGRFQETFERVNGELQALFPKLFGGGEAYLEMSSEDLLETGVRLMARPPGKRNSTIHLLSGGEKALTALSLVFSIFKLNPAPFCLLDEVDAPLDDVNAARFCELLRSMCAQVQFLFVTHNKITMEIAERLIGVTMQEAGVSRLVAVDMDEAVRLAASA